MSVEDRLAGAGCDCSAPREVRSRTVQRKALLRLCALGYFIIPRPRAPIAEDHRQRDQDLHHADNALQDDVPGGPLGCHLSGQLQYDHGYAPGSLQAPQERAGHSI
jgi:hypothetical protein